MNKNHKVYITDTTLRDAHQSLWATRMRTEDMIPIVPLMDEIGFWSFEMWGGATFDVALRYLNESPWERIRKIKQNAKNTRLQMLLRGQNLVGYRHYPDDIVRRFVKLAHQNGIDVFRVFDALNDVRNFEVAMETIKKEGAWAEACVVYTISPIHTEEHYVNTAKKLTEMGADSICIKDMAGILKPKAAVSLIKAIKKAVPLPIHLHCHYIGGMATMNYVEGIEAGASMIDTASFPLAFGNSQPATEVLVAALKETPYDTGLNLEKLYEIAEYFEELRKRRGLRRGQTSLVHMRIFSHQTPGGMISNLYSQLEEQKALDKLDDVLEEVPRVRAEVGYPPLVTPLSQIVGIQAVLNVLAGKRWSVIAREMRDYLKGLYGRPPGEISEKVLKKVLKSNDEIIDVRPGALLTKTINDYREEIKDLVEKDEDVITYALFPKEAKEYFKRRKRYKDERYQSRAEAGEEDYMNIDEIKKIIDYVEEKNIGEVVVEKDGLKVAIRKKVTVGADIEVEETETEPEKKEKESTEEIEEKKAKPKERPDSWKEIKAPMVGTFYRAPSPEAPPYVEVDSKVKPGDVLCLIEAMKLFNEVTADEEGIIKEICVKNSQSVEYGQTLFYFEATQENSS